MLCFVDGSFGSPPSLLDLVKVALGFVNPARGLDSLDRRMGRFDPGIPRVDRDIAKSSLGFENVDRRLVNRSLGLANGALPFPRETLTFVSVAFGISNVSRGLGRAPFAFVKARRRIVRVSVAIASGAFGLEKASFAIRDATFSSSNLSRRPDRATVCFSNVAPQIPGATFTKPGHASAIPRPALGSAKRVAWFPDRPPHTT